MPIARLARRLTHPLLRVGERRRQVDLEAQLDSTRLDAEGADRWCFGIEQSIFAAPHTPQGL
jgi:hypothetical protein